MGKGANLIREEYHEFSVDIVVDRIIASQNVQILIPRICEQDIFHERGALQM